MTLNPMADDGRDERVEQRLRQLGTRTPCCRTCGESDPLVLGGHHPDITCYGCQAFSDGRPWTEQQHPAGRANHPFNIAMPGNEHRWVDDLKHDWPEQTLRNPDGSPLLKAAACIRGWMDTLLLIVQRTVGWIPAFLERLDSALTNMHGQLWWQHPGFGLT